MLIKILLQVSKVSAYSYFLGNAVPNDAFPHGTKWISSTDNKGS